MTTNGGILQDLSINHDLITTKFSCSIQSRNTVSITRDDSSLLSYRKSYIAWDKLERANKPDNYTEKTKYLSKNAKALLSVYIDKNKIINNRSNKSNFCKFNSGSNNTDQLKDSEVSKNTEITKNGFLGSGKHLNEMLEYLTDDICNILRTRSGRNFTDRAIKEIAKAVSRSKQGSKAFFYHIKGFIAYLSKILRFEKRDTIKISSINYYIASNLTENEKIIQKQEK
jgi:hypothetical protein